jgi:hypothetical protein
MRMRENLTDIYKSLTQDETLLRLLYYQPINANDSPLDPAKQNILDKPVSEKWEIVLDRIKTTSKTDDLDNVQKCRILFYAGRRGNTSNYLIANQQIIFDVLCHFSFEEVDLRSSWINDRLNEILFDSRITGIGKITFEGGSPIAAPNNYVGYRLMYSIGSGKD